ncbi:MAG: membrane protein insertase YidC [Chitinispirillales bacterium]|nr:membrane protein insertase YidC [Chitinispirillales bacterium]
MNKNSVLAFLLIAASVVFFNSDLWNNFWYGTILRKPVPTYTRPAPKPAAEQQETTQKAAAAEKRVSPQESTLGESAEAETGHEESVSAETALTTVEDTIIIETDRIIAEVSTKGGRIVSLRMKDFYYTTGDRKGEMIDLLPAGSEGGAQLSINNESFDEKFFSSSHTSSDAPIVVGDEPFELVLETKSSRGKTIQKVFTFSNETYKIGYTVRGDGLADQKVTLGWKGGIEESEKSQGGMFDQTERRRAHYSDGRSANHIEMSKKGTEEPSGAYRWVGMSSKYFFVSVVADKIYDADIRIEGRNVSKNPYDKNSEINYAIFLQKQATSNEINASIYAGPNKIQELSQHNLGFEKTMFPVLSFARHIFWADRWFPPIAEIVLRVLLFFYAIVKDYGIAIFLLTLLTKLITYPMTASSMKSMNKMKDLQPKLTALRSKYKSNPQKMNAEIMALYKAEGINPLNPGCLPMFLQMPIFIALFVVLRKAVELRGASSAILPWISDLSHPEVLFSLPFSIPIYGSNVALLPILMAAVTFYQQKMTITDPNQKMIVYMMPILMLVMFNGFPAGVVFYWTLSSAFGLLQQMWMNKKNKVTPAAATVSGTPVKKGPPAKKAASRR